MQLKVVYLSVVYNLFLYECFSNALAYEQFDVENYSLVGHQLKTLTNVRFDKCVKACKMERACISVNYGGSSGKTGCCTLKDCGVEDEEDKAKSLVFTPGCLYQQIRPTEAAIIKGGKYTNKCPVKIPVGRRGKPGRSCRQILQARGNTNDGQYWIDPANSGLPFSVYCDMSTDGGGWTLIKRTVLSNSTPLTNVITVSDYRMISEQVENRIVDNDGLVKLKQDMGFDQLRLYCRKKSVGRTFHIMTNNDTLGRNAVRSMIGTFKPRAQACGSFTALPDDTSVLSKNCGKWGYMGGFNKGKWGSDFSEAYHGKNRLYLRSAFMQIGTTKYHVTYLPTAKYRCDSKWPKVSAGDRFEIYVR